ncbi:MAG: class I SAM-dependent methyltransferase [Candidatus Eisenbacteria bacterium]|nr:class I SAM-dependent methyltransferase [Candidatus Eisenbacteria bacterium]
MTPRGPSRVRERRSARRGRPAPAGRRAEPGAESGDKRYDQRYFDRWYRRSKLGVGAREFVARKVRLAVAAAEYVLARPIRTVLDVGCGEGAWRPILARMRPGIEYTGFDSSDYAIRRFGRRRNLHRGSLGEMGFVGLRGQYDLVVCADVLHYVRSPELRAGLAALAPHVGGVAFIEAFTNSDQIEGDRAELQDRTAAVYRRFFEEAGLAPLGLHLYVTRRAFAKLAELERGAAG